MKAPAPEELTELAVLTLINNWCIESLCPEHFEQWEQVLEGLIVSRKKLASWRMSSALAPSKPPITAPPSEQDSDGLPSIKETP